MKRIAIIGGGSWGTALALVASRNGHQVRLWSRNQQVVDAINRSHLNNVYLANVVLPESILATGQLAEALGGADLVIMAAPSHATRKLLGDMSPNLTGEMIFVGATKGLEIETGKRMSQVLREV